MDRFLVYKMLIIDLNSDEELKIMAKLVIKEERSTHHMFVLDNIARSFGVIACKP